MYVTGFDGNEYPFRYAKNQHRKNRKKSRHHIEARELINEIFPRNSVYEEPTLPGSKKLGRSSFLYADFFIPDYMLIVEVHGRQHYEYISFFYKNRMDFVKAKQRDRDKIEWCKMNDFKIVILPYNEKEKWKELILKTIIN